MAKRSVAKMLEPDPRDGPTVEFRVRHDIVERAGASGKRTLSKIEQLLRSRYIRPEQSEAALRFRRDYFFGVIGHGRSCLDMGTGGGGDGHPSMERLDALTRYKTAAAALAEAHCPTLQRGSAADLLALVCAEDRAFSQIATDAGVSDDTVKSWIAQILTVLAGHYARLDRASGRETTVYTHEAALRRFEPEL